MNKSPAVAWTEPQPHHGGLPPDCAKEAARRTRVALMASRGPFMLALGVLNLLCGSAFWVLGERVGHITLGVWALAAGVGCLFIPAYIQRARLRAGIKVVEKGDLDFTRSMNPPVKPAFMIAMILGVSLGLVSMALVSFWPAVAAKSAMDYAVSLAFAVFGAICIWQYGRLGCWEGLVLAAGMFGAGAAYVTLEAHALSAALLSLGAGSLVAGASLCVRWRKWVAALPKENIV